jgi:hypothetical protein
MHTFVLRTIANSVPKPRQRNITLKSAVKSLSRLSRLREKDIIYELDPILASGEYEYRSSDLFISSSPVVLEATTGDFFTEYEEELSWLKKYQGLVYADMTPVFICRLLDAVHVLFISLIDGVGMLEKPFYYDFLNEKFIILV